MRRFLQQNPFLQPTPLCLLLGTLSMGALAQNEPGESSPEPTAESISESTSEPAADSVANSPATPAATTLDAVTITATSPVRTGDVSSDESTASQSHIERVELERTPDALATVLARESGVQRRQSGGFGSFSSVSIRAASGAQTSVFLDGVLLNSGGNPVVDFSTLEILNLDSVDIYRGSTPMQLGYGAIGGAINLNTLQSTDEPVTRIRLGIGSLSQAGLQLSHQGKYGQWDTAAAISHRQSENDFVYDNLKITPLNSDDVVRANRNNADARRTAALLRAGYKQNLDSRTDLTLQVSERKLGVPELGNNPGNQASYDTQASQFQLSQVWDAIDRWNSRSSVYWLQNDSQYQDREAQVGLGAQDTSNDGRTLGARTYWEYLANTGTLGLSLDVRRETLGSTDELDTSLELDAQRQSTLATLHYAWFDTSETWSLTPALRWQNNRLEATKSSSSENFDTNSDTSNTGLQLGLAYRPNWQLSITANAGSYYREPSFGELYSSSGLINGNPDLEAEEGVNMDIGVQYKTEIMNLSASAFLSRRDELIVTDFNSRGIGSPENTGKARVTGLELSAELAVTPTFGIRSNLTLQSPKNLDDAVGFRNKYLPGEAQIAWSSRMQYQVLRTTFWYELDVLKDRFYDTANNLPAEDSDVHSIGVDWKNAQWQTTLGIQNLGDDNVEDFNGFPKPGRTWSLAIIRTL